MTHLSGTSSRFLFRHNRVEVKMSNFDIEVSFQSLIVNTIITIFVAIFTAKITTQITYNSEIKKSIYQEREKAYILLFQMVEKLNRNPYLIYNFADFIIPLRKLKARLNLYASQKVLDIITPLNEKICDSSEKYSELFNSPEALDIRNSRLENGEITELELQHEEEIYMDNNVIERKFVEEIFLDLITQIRSELKTD